MPTARLALLDDLEGLLDLFQVSEGLAVAEPAERAEVIWSETLAREGLAVFVSESGERIAATCMLITASNVLREGRGHGFLETLKPWLPILSAAAKATAALSFEPHLTRHGTEIATMCCCKAVERIRVSIDFTSVAVLNQGYESAMSHAVHRIAVQKSSRLQQRAANRCREVALMARTQHDAAWALLAVAS